MAPPLSWESFAVLVPAELPLTSTSRSRTIKSLWTYRRSSHSDKSLSSFLMCFGLLSNDAAAPKIVGRWPSHAVAKAWLPLRETT